MSAGILGCVFLPFGLIILDLYLKRRRNPSGFPYPPGPRQLPLVGNLFDIPERKAWETYARWASQYGEAYPDGSHHALADVCSWTKFQGILYPFKR